MYASIENIWPASERMLPFFLIIHNTDDVLPYYTSFSFAPSYLLSKTLSDHQNSQYCILHEDVECANVLSETTKPRRLNSELLPCSPATVNIEL